MIGLRINVKDIERTIVEGFGDDIKIYEGVHNL